jgi:hypothetical protein
MGATITLPESGIEIEIKSFSRKEMKELREAATGKTVDEYWDLVIEKAKIGFAIDDDTPGADIAYLAKTLLAYSAGGPDSIKN